MDAKTRRVIGKRVKHIAGGNFPYEDGRYYYAIGFYDEELGDF